MDFLWILAALSAGFVKGLSGFANTLAFTSVMSFGAANVNISPVDLMLSYPANAIVTIKERRSIMWRVVLPLTAIVVVGCIPGMLLLKNADTTLIKLCFGIVTVLIAIDLLLREIRRSNKRMSPVGGGLLAVLSGVLCGLYGVGALLGAYISREAKDTSEFRGSFSFIFAVENTVRTVIYSVLGILTLDTLLRGASLIPFMLLGLLVGTLISKRVPPRVAKLFVIILLIFSGLSLAIGAIGGLIN